MYSRRVLILHFQQVYYRPPPTLTTTQTATTSSLDKAYSTSSNGFNANVVMVLSVLLCALFCSLGLNSLIRCTLRCSSFINRAPSTDTALNIENPLPVGAGLTKKELKAFPTVSFLVDDESLQNSDCVICLSEFVAGDRVRLLPECNHGFHVRCIDKWLNSHSSCPTCRSSLVVHNSPNMVVGDCTPLAASSSADPQPQLSRLDSVAPLERESMIHTTTY